MNINYYTPELYGKILIEQSLPENVYYAVNYTLLEENEN